MNYPNGYKDVQQVHFIDAYNQAFTSENVSANCTPLEQCDFSQKTLFLSSDGLSGFAISFDGELTNVFSLVKGRGKVLMGYAIGYGANNLDCFDGYLVPFYAQAGFIEVRREANWTVGQPDVVYMVLAN